ncbi:MAG: GNAT family N-acetyltransferase [Pseudomonadota bacterium]
MADGASLIRSIEAPIALQQHPRFAAAMLSIGGETVVMETATGPLLGLQRRVGPLAFRLYSRASLTPQDGRDLGHDRGAFEGIAVTPETAMDIDGFLPVMGPAHVTEWNLDPSPAALRRALAGTWRNGLKKAERAGLHFDISPPNRAALDGLFAADRRHQRYRGFRALPHAFAAAYTALPGDPAWFVRVRTKEGRALAVALILLHPPGASYHLATATAEGRAVGAPRFLLWETALALREAGYLRLDLGPVDSDRAKGLLRFKAGTGAAIRSLGPTLFAGPLTPMIDRLRQAANR